MRNFIKARDEFEALEGGVVALLANGPVPGTRVTSVKKQAGLLLLKTSVELSKEQNSQLWLIADAEGIYKALEQAIKFLLANDPVPGCELNTATGQARKLLETASRTLTDRQIVSLRTHIDAAERPRRSDGRRRLAG